MCEWLLCLNVQFSAGSAVGWSKHTSDCSAFQMHDLLCEHTEQHNAAPSTRLCPVHYLTLLTETQMFNMLQNNEGKAELIYLYSTFHTQRKFRVVKKITAHQLQSKLCTALLWWYLSLALILTVEHMPTNTALPHAALPRICITKEERSWLCFKTYK